MFDWDGLPEAVQLKCVGYMDLITRGRFRSCSYLSYRLDYYNSADFPRVRFGEKQGRYLLVIYTGVGKFLRVEFRKGKGKTVMYKSVDTLENPQQKMLPYPDHYEIAVLTLKSLVLRPNVRMDTFEWNIGIGAENHARFNEMYGEGQLKLRTAVFRSARGKQRIYSDCDFYYFINDARLVLREEHSTEKTDDVPIMHVRIYKNGGEHSERFTTFYSRHEVVTRMKDGSPRDKLNKVLEDAMTMLTLPGFAATITYPMFSREDEKAIFDEIPEEATWSNGVDVKRVRAVYLFNSVYLFKHSPLCGLSITLVGENTSMCKELEENLEPCVKGDTCKHHKSRFEQWLLEQPPRCLSEPFWADLDKKDEIEEEKVDEEQVQQEAEKKKKKKKNKKKNKKKKKNDKEKEGKEGDSQIEPVDNENLVEPENKEDVEESSADDHHEAPTMEV